MDEVKLINNASDKNKLIYEKNIQLLQLARQHMCRFGGMFAILSGIGKQDVLFADEWKFSTIYPYSHIWFELAYGRKCQHNEWITTNTDKQEEILQYKCDNNPPSLFTKEKYPRRRAHVHYKKMKKTCRHQT